VSRWKLKWAVIYGQANPILYIYDQRDHPEPKYIIKLDHVKLFLLEDVPKAIIESTREGGFVLVSNRRKVSSIRQIDIPD
jgi:hypothetical protein